MKLTPGEATTTSLSFSLEMQDCARAAYLLIANPIPMEYALDKEIIEPAVAQAMEEARERKLRGKLLTPFLLERLAQLTDGATVEARLQILYNKARLGARLAAQVARLSR